MNNARAASSQELAARLILRHAIASFSCPVAYNLREKSDEG
jgi:hypothetical protein